MYQKFGISDKEYKTYIHSREKWLEKQKPLKLPENKIALYVGSGSFTGLSHISQIIFSGEYILSDINFRKEIKEKYEGHTIIFTNKDGWGVAKQNIGKIGFLMLDQAVPFNKEIMKKLPEGCYFFSWGVDDCTEKDFIVQKEVKEIEETGFKHKIMKWDFQENLFIKK